MIRAVSATAAFFAAVAATPSWADVRPLPGGAEASSNGLTVRVEALTDSILRVRVATNGRWSEDASWAVPQAVRSGRAAIRAAADGFSTGSLVVHIDSATLALTVTDPQGRTIVADEPRPMRLDGPRFTLAKALPVGEHIYGLGDKTGSFDRRGESFVDWNTDAYGFQRDTDPIYKTIPFYVASGAEGAPTDCSSTIHGAAGSTSDIARRARSASAQTVAPSIIT
jgi:alpha-glucosidase